ncbi:unnamed protein product [Allacma fusca]|uniref:Uncharacterized protein n=1 Tax=Allacma fusca TaxID=39272 RepID=A0A8J2J3X2_9HEXA|nr:unnamed protein product [Allacma fusca]
MHIKESNGTLPKEMADFISGADNWFPQQDVLANPKYTFSGAMRQISENKKYSNAMKEASARFRDRPTPVFTKKNYSMNIVISCCTKKTP